MTNTGKCNSGDRNSGYRNSGDGNLGNWNSGDGNVGNYNSGDYNSGDRNSGDANSGNYNLGDYNAGDCNSGDANSGNYNLGDWNAGDSNSGNWNSGSNNSGAYNSGDGNSGLFNTDEPTVRLFNKDSGKLRKDLDIPFVKLPITQWLDSIRLTEEQKAAHPEHKTLGGLLIKRTYKEAWAIAWKRLHPKDKQLFKDLPNFCPHIFKDITGIDVENEGKMKVDANGKFVYISKDSAIALGLIEGE